MIHFMLLQNRMGVTRLAKFYAPADDAEREAISKEVHGIVCARDSNQANFVVFRGNVKLVYRRYAGLLFVLGVDEADNDFSCLELIHLIVEVFDLFFTDVCELDLVFNFHKVHMIVDEVISGGEIQEICRQKVIEKLKKLECCIVPPVSSRLATLSMTVLVWLGVALFIHAIYMMYTLVDSDIQEPGLSFQSMIAGTATLSTAISPMKTAASVETMVALVLVMAGYIRTQRFTRSRLHDLNKRLRVDASFNSGPGFIHFNHRGTLGDGRSGGKGEEKGQARLAGVAPPADPMHHNTLRHGGNVVPRVANPNQHVGDLSQESTQLHTAPHSAATTTIMLRKEIRSLFSEVEIETEISTPSPPLFNDPNERTINTLRHAPVQWSLAPVVSVSGGAREDTDSEMYGSSSSFFFSFFGSTVCGALPLLLAALEGPPPHTHHSGAKRYARSVPLGTHVRPTDGPSSPHSRLFTTFCATPALLGNKGGTPKRKKNPMQLRRKVYGIHFKERYLRLEEWYYCPLCAEPKRQGEWCRREDCRQIKP
eukprot:gene7262-5108_t